MSTPASQSLSERQSQRKHAEAEEEKTKKKRSKTKKSASSPVQINPIWNEQDELALLKELVDYQAKTGLQSNVDWKAFHRFVGDSIAARFSKKQIRSKMRDLKERFLTRMEKINPGDDPIFSEEEEAFGYSNMIWGQNDSDFANDDIKNVIENVEPWNAGMKTESSDGNDGIDADDDEWLRDAFETLVSWRGLSDYQKKFQLGKLMNLARVKRKELSDEWKALCSEEAKLKTKMLRITANLAETANYI
uniref:Glabrous enhancer-binding protein-like DBD domain-containing protein n=1 Tax=Noccaea caerulescens TaxID=107243 RepID=A0A1J3E044_NOCCA